MQITGEEDYAIASTIVSEHNYNLQNAIDNRYVYTSNNVQQDEHYE